MIAKGLRFLTKQGNRFASSVRKTMLRLRYPNFQIGSNVTICPGVRIEITDGGKLAIGSDTTINQDCFIKIRGGELTIGDGCFVGMGSVICAIESIHIGDDCLIAEYVSIRDQNHGISISEVPFGKQPLISKPIQIAANVWLGAKSSVLAGATIGENSVIAAHAVVIRSVEPNTIVGGVPAKEIRKLAERSPTDA